jgi:hypothetical protein
VPAPLSKVLDFLYATLQPAAHEGEIDGQADGGLDNGGDGNRAHPG